VRTDEINVQLMLAEPAPSALQSWKASPPDAFSGFELADESYNSLTWEKRWMTWYMKITYALSLGLFGRQGESIWKATARFDDDPSGGTKVTIVGMLDEGTRAALGRWAAERGRIVQDWGLTAP
jgi:hypothetical protein